MTVPFGIISKIWSVSGRDIVVVATGYGDQVAFFYRRTGLGNKGAGVAVAPGSWAPFKTLMEQESGGGGVWINKRPYYTQVGPDDPLRGYGNMRNQQIGQWLDGQNLPKGTTARWDVVEKEMDRIRAQYQQMVKAVGAETAAIKLEASGAKAAATAAKGARLTRVSKLLLALGLPGPQDVFFLFLSAFASIAQAKAQLKSSAFATGFSQGLAAKITGTPKEEAARLLLYKAVTPSSGERVSGFEGVRERGTNEGLVAGWKFGEALDADQRNGFVATAFGKIKESGKSIRGDFRRDDLIDIGIALRPTAIQLLAEAERQERLARAQEAATSRFSRR